jgi:hypothetical protein
VGWLPFCQFLSLTFRDKFLILLYLTFYSFSICRISEIAFFFIKVLMYLIKKILPFIISTLCLSSCERQQDDIRLYDLFPINIGNEYFYTYKWYDINVGIYEKLENGNLRWCIFQKSENDTSKVYEIKETKYNRIYIDSYDTTYPENSVSHFNIYEHNNTSQLTIKNWGAFPRYSEIRDTIFELELRYYDSGTDHYEWHFKADSGLVYFNFQYYIIYRHRRNSFTLDSLKIIK